MRIAKCYILLCMVLLPNITKPVLSCKNKKTIKIQRDLKSYTLVNIIVSGTYIIFMKIQLNPFQDTLINYSCRSSMNKF